MQSSKNPFRNASLPQTSDTNSYGGNRGGSTRGRRGNFHAGNRGSFSGGGRGGRGFKRGGFGRGRGGFGRGRGGGFRSNNLKIKEENWGKVKFNPVASTAKEEYATPWHKFKYDMVQNKDLNKANLEGGQDAKDLKEKLAKNNRKAQILLNQQQPTEWDDFGAADVNRENIKRKKESKKQAQHNKKPQKEPGLETPRKEYSRGDELLKNFESNNLSNAQKNHLRKVITKTTLLARDKRSLNSLHSAVEDMKRQEELKVKKRKLKSESK